MPGHMGGDNYPDPAAERPEPIIKPGSIAPWEDTADMIARIGAEHVEHHRMQRHYKPLIGFGYVMAAFAPFRSTSCQVSRYASETRQPCEWKTSKSLRRGHTGRGHLPPHGAE
jgi:hypothetical protein